MAEHRERFGGQIKDQKTHADILTEMHLDAAASIKRYEGDDSETARHLRGELQGTIDFVAAEAAKRGLFLVLDDVAA